MVVFSNQIGIELQDRSGQVASGKHLGTDSTNQQPFNLQEKQTRPTWRTLRDLPLKSPLWSKTCILMCWNGSEWRWTIECQWRILELWRGKWNIRTRPSKTLNGTQIQPQHFSCSGVTPAPEAEGKLERRKLWQIWFNCSAWWEEKMPWISCHSTSLQVGGSDQNQTRSALSVYSCKAVLVMFLRCRWILLWFNGFDSRFLVRH